MMGGEGSGVSVQRFDEVLLSWLSGTTYISRKVKDQVLLRELSCLRRGTHARVSCAAHGHHDAGMASSAAELGRREACIKAALRQQRSLFHVSVMRHAAECLSLSADVSVLHSLIDTQCVMQLRYDGKHRTVATDVEGVVLELCKQHTCLRASDYVHHCRSVDGDGGGRDAFPRGTAHPSHASLSALDHVDVQSEYQEGSPLDNVCISTGVSPATEHASDGENVWLGRVLSVQSWLPEDDGLLEPSNRCEVETRVSCAADENAAAPSFSMHTVYSFRIDGRKVENIHRTLHIHDPCNYAEVLSKLHFGSFSQC